MALGWRAKSVDGALSGARTSIADYSGKKKIHGASTNWIERGWQRQRPASARSSWGMVDPVSKLLKNSARKTNAVHRVGPVQQPGVVRADQLRRNIPYPTHSVCNMKSRGFYKWQ